MSSGAARSQAEIDQENMAFWDELCGSQLARQLEIEDDSPESLRKFDDWYFDFYPYLHDHIPFSELAGKRLLEVGLGYGTVAQKIAGSGADYEGLDIAGGPVAMVRHRLKQMKLPGKATQGSVLEAPFPDSSFDWVVAIGCLHHTGDLQAAIDEVHRLLKPAGNAMIMVYNASSYRQWARETKATVRRIMSRPEKYAERLAATEKMRGSYDSNVSGEAAPQTEFVTAAELTHMCRNFASCRITRENIGAEGPLRLLPRPLACRLFGSSLGLDLYCRLQK